MSELPIRDLGRTGRQVTVLGLGCASYWARPGFPERRAEAVFDSALACGIRLFDTGPSYAGGEAERRLGRLLRAAGRRHDDLLIATKAGTATADGRTRRDFSAGAVTRQLEQSLVRLGLDRIPLLQLHGPQPEDLNDALLTALERARRDGKVALLGINADQAVLEQWSLPSLFEVVMPFVSVLRPDGARFAADAAERGLAVLAAEPLGRMRFAPPLARWLTRASGLWYLARLLAETRGNASAGPAALPARTRPCIRDALRCPGWTPAQLALAWTISRRGVAGAVFGTTRPEHVRELVGAASRPIPESVEAAISSCLADAGVGP